MRKKQPIVFSRIQGIIFALIGLNLFFFNCIPPPEVIKDIQTFRQNNTFYLNSLISDRRLVSSEYQQQIDEKYDSLYFKPWHLKKTRYNRGQAFKGFDLFNNNLGYGENKRKHTPEWLEKILINADSMSYPNIGAKGITVANSDLRVLPIHQPLFYDFSLPGEGYPFDNLQNSAIAANTPVFIIHQTKDKSWVLVDSHYCIGWIPTRDVAFVDQAFMESWESGRYITVIKDKSPVYSKGKLFLFHAFLGSVFPIAGEDSLYFQFWTASADTNRKAMPARGFLPRDQAAVKPLPLTQLNIAMLADQLINEPYGWGGLYENRDCSALIKDLFAPFGLWLPRNSSAQARSGSTIIDLSQMISADKEKTILEKGIPYMTLVWLKGHDMLYIGRYHGQPLVFHNLWGIRTRSFWGKEGRKIIGHAAITSLSPGKELSNADEEGEILKRISGMTLLVPPGEIWPDSVISTKLE